jgi:hypothetical protein
VAHRAPEVGYRAQDLLKDRRPAGIRDLADEDVAGLQAADILDRFDDACRAFDDSTGGGKAADLVRSTVTTGLEPAVEALASDAPEHDDCRIIDDVGHRTERGRSVVLRPLCDRCASLGHDIRPARRTARR